MNVQKLENQLSVVLPEEYRQLLNDYPSQLAELDYFDDASQGGPRNFELLADPQEILELNRRERRRWPQADYSHAVFPDSYFLIGWDGCGNLFALDLAAQDGTAVYEFDHEEAEWALAAESLSAFVTHLQTMAAELRKQ